MPNLKPKITIYYNPQCSKCRQTLALLRERGSEPEIVEYLKTPPSREEIAAILDRLEGSPHDLLRVNEEAHQKLNLSSSNPKEQIIEAISKNPILMQRPVVVVGEKAVIARPPEKALSLL